MHRLLTAIIILFTASGALADGRAYLDGRFDLDLSRSHWADGPALFAGGFWVFERDDGKTRTGYGV